VNLARYTLDIGSVDDSILLENFDGHLKLKRPNPKN
jgi:hypothetical protein